MGFTSRTLKHALEQAGVEALKRGSGGCRVEALGGGGCL